MIEFNNSIPDYGDVFTLGDWKECLEIGLFMPYDGCGNFSNGEMMTSNFQDDVFGEIPKEVSHIVWFNK